MKRNQGKIDERDIGRRLWPYFNIALVEADKSPCVRRKYAAMIVYDWYGDIDIEDNTWNPWHIAFNERVTDQCTRSCIRVRLPTPHGYNSERGAEVHAEQAALIKAGVYRLHSYFILVGKDSKTGEELLGSNCYPCHVCAVMLKWAGYRFIYHKDDIGRIIATDIGDIIEYRERQVEALTDAAE